MSLFTTKLSTNRQLLYGITFLMGGCGIAYEYTFSKISSDLLGNSVHQWAIIIGLMMLCMGIGSDLQKHIKDIKVFNAFIKIELILGIVGGFGPLVLIVIFGSSRDYFVLMQYSLTIITGLCIGLEIPLLTRINERYTPELKVNIGGILRMDYIGAFIGALTWVFLLPRFFTLIESAFILGLVNNGAALFSLFYFQRNKKNIALKLAAIGTMVVLISGLIFAKPLTLYGEQQLFLDKLVYSKTTKYQHIAITESKSGNYYCYINGHLQFASADEYVYHEFLVHPIMSIAPRRENVLVLGGGDGLAVREILKYPEVKMVTLVDIDPEMISIAKKNSIISSLNEGSLFNSKVTIVENNVIDSTIKELLRYPNRAERLKNNYGDFAEVQILPMDAAKFIEQIPQMYDIIIIDFPDPNSVELSKLYSQSFYENLRSKLNADGLIVQQSSSPYLTPRVFRCIGTTMNHCGFEVVPYHGHVPSFGDWGWWIGGKRGYYTAGKITERVLKITHLNRDLRYLTPPLIHGSLNFGKDVDFSHDENYNTIINNVIFKYYINDIRGTK